MTTCSGLTSALGVDTAGTASAIRSFLLLETPGAWPEDVRERSFRDALGDAAWDRLRALWLERQLRPLVVRRPGGARGSEPVLLLGSTHGTRFLEQLPAAALPDVDLEALADGRPGHGEPLRGPLLAVCTNGSVDRCCAVRGRPLVAALAAAHPERTWEVSHVGGCRFAANLLVLPDGVMHGALTPDAGLAVAAAALRGSVELSRLRGRTGVPRFAGAAEVALRRRLDLHGLDDVVVVGERPHADAVDGEDGPEPAGADVLLRTASSAWTAVVRHRHLTVADTVCDGPTDVDTTDVVQLLPA